MIRHAAACLALIGALSAAVPALAQEGPAAAMGTGAVLRGLDKVSGKVSDLELKNGEFAALGELTIALKECRYPEGDAAGDAFALLTIAEEGAERALFSGWMIASSPALNALDHARFDVWVLRCTSS